MLTSTFKNTIFFGFIYLFGFKLFKNKFYLIESHFKRNPLTDYLS